MNDGWSDPLRALADAVADLLRRDPAVRSAIRGIAETALRELARLDAVQSDFNIDATRVFASGFSNGGMLSYRLACELSDRIAGIAAVGGASGQFDFDRNRYYSCNPTRPIPILHIHSAQQRPISLARFG